MKKSIIILSALTMTLASFKTFSPEERITKGDIAGERLASQIVTAFQHRSLQEYSSLFPSLEYFHGIMEKNAAIYGPNLEEAKEEFEQQYTTLVLPAMNQSFKTVIAQGMKAGIDWASIKLVSVEFGDENAAATPATIRFTSNGKEYRLRFEKTLSINGEWKVSQYVSLI
jgi:hypothetical protein